MFENSLIQHKFENKIIIQTKIKHQNTNQTSKQNIVASEFDENEILRFANSQKRLLKINEKNQRKDTSAQNK